MKIWIAEHSPQVLPSASHIHAVGYGTIKLRTSPFMHRVIKSHEFSRSYGALSQRYLGIVARRTPMGTVPRVRQDRFTKCIMISSICFFGQIDGLRHNRKLSYDVVLKVAKEKEVRT